MQFSTSASQSLSLFFSQLGSSSHRLRTVLVFEKQGPYTKERYPITTMKLQSDHPLLVSCDGSTGFRDAEYSINGMAPFRKHTQKYPPTINIKTNLTDPSAKSSTTSTPPT